MTAHERERFDAKWTPEPNTGCFLWLGTRTWNGYGHFKLDGKPRRAHRLAWELTNGAIPGDLQVLHRCDVRECVNPDHLFLGTQADNIVDRDAKGRGVWSPGAKNGQAKLTPAQVSEIRRLAAIRSQASIARDFGMSKAATCLIVNRKRWKEN